LGKIRFYFAASLDGYIADPQGGVGFLDPFHDGGDGDADGFEEFFSSVGTIVMGRATYKFAEDYGSWPYEHDRRTIVLTRRPIERPLSNLQARIVEDFGAFAHELRGFDGDAWIVGGGQIMGSFLAIGEVDSIEMSIVPVAIGIGIPMYAGNATISQRFKLLDLARKPNGTVRLVYEKL
jgi:dihydrofolate reductase